MAMRVSAQSTITITIPYQRCQRLSVSASLCAPDKSYRPSTLDSIFRLKNHKMSIEVVSSGQYTKSKINRVKSEPFIDSSIATVRTWSSILIYFKCCLKRESNSINCYEPFDFNRAQSLQPYVDGANWTFEQLKNQRKSFAANLNI